jgi:murein DD-endopeptidase MepM/ murein hydrolase activator NlpD
VWDWSLDVEGSLALDRSEDWLELVANSGHRPSRGRLKAAPASATVAEMAPATAYRRPQRGPSRAVRRARRRALAVLLVLAVLVVLAVSAFGTGGGTVVGVGVPASASRLLPAGPPNPLVIAVQGALRIQLPVNERNVTAIGYHGAGEDALALDPLGRQANEGLFSRLFHRIFGGSGGGIAYYQLGGGGGPSTGSLNVGAAPGTDVFAPVDGTVVGLRAYILDGETYGSVIELQPSGQPSVIVSITHLRADPALTVGATLTAGTSKVGKVIDFSGVERLALARYTQDAGNQVALEVHPASSVPLR